MITVKLDLTPDQCQYYLSIDEVPLTVHINVRDNKTHRLVRLRDVDNETRLALGMGGYINDGGYVDLAGDIGVHIFLGRIE